MPTRGLSRVGCMSAVEISKPISEATTHTSKCRMEIAMPMLVARTPGPSVVQGNHPGPSISRTASIVIPVALVAIALLVLAALAYSRCRNAISVTPIFHNINDPEEPTMWEVHVASAVKAPQFVGKQSWCEIMPVSVQGISEPNLSASTLKSAQPSLADRRCAGQHRLPRPCRDDWQKGPLVDSGDYRIAVLIALPTPLIQPKEKAMGHLAAPPALCFGLTDACQDEVRNIALTRR